MMTNTFALWARGRNLSDFIIFLPRYHRSPSRGNGAQLTVKFIHESPAV